MECRNEKRDCVNLKNGRCHALSDYANRNGKCVFYVGPEQHLKDMELIKRRTG